jgi:hypothetical protein
MRRRAVAIGLLLSALLGGCGFSVQAADDFLLTRTGQDGELTLLVNDSGTIRCNGGRPKRIANSLLIQARDLVDSLDADATAKLTIPASANSVYTYKVSMQDGKISFPDTAATRHHELAGAEQFTLAALAGPCKGA